MPPHDRSDPSDGRTAPGLFALFEESQWWDRNRLETHQRQMLDGLVRHAAQSAPFYAFRLGSILKTDGSIDWSRWTSIPVLSRADLANYSATIRARKAPAAHGPFFTVETSGSTGHPVSLTTTEWLNAMIRAMGWRAQTWFDVDWSQTLLSRSYVPLKDLQEGDNLGPWGPPAHSRSKRGRNIYTFGLDHDRFFDLMIREKPAYVSIYSGSIEILCEISERRGSALTVDTFFSRGGSVSNATREWARNLFGARVIEGYSAQECGSIAYECPSRSGFHISAEAALVEIIRDDGNPALPGEEGRVIVTPFASTATPLIRYDLGDRAVAGDICGCGRSLPLIRSILGREMHAFRHPAGTAHFGARIAVLRPMIGASRWQVAQVGPVRFEVRYIAAKDVDHSIIPEFVRSFRQRIFEEAEVGFMRVAEIPLTASGKFIEFVNEWGVSKS